MVVSVLSCSDKGCTLSFWKRARVTLIPKDDDSPPSDRRPITVLSVTYRVWAKRHASHLNLWLSTWEPHGLSWAGSNTSCPDVLWEVVGLLSNAGLGHRAPAFVLSMDQAKCFDRLDLNTLRRVCGKLSLPSCLVALHNYETLGRLPFVDNEPSDVWLEGEGSAGVPS